MLVTYHVKIMNLDLFQGLRGPKSTSNYQTALLNSHLQIKMTKNYISNAIVLNWRYTCIMNAALKC